MGRKQNQEKRNTKMEVRLAHRASSLTGLAKEGTAQYPNSKTSGVGGGGGDYAMAAIRNMLQHLPWAWLK